MQNFNWPGLLKWSIQYIDEPSENVKARSKEDLEFLEEAIRLAHGQLPDYHKTCLEAITLLSASDASQLLAALGTIQDCLDMEPELARDLANRPEAVKQLLDCVSRVEPLSLEQACLALNSMLPNNPKMQKLVFEFGGLSIFMRRLEPLLTSCLAHSNPDELRLLSRLYGCVSSLVKSTPEIERAFVKENPQGLDATLDILMTIRDPRLVTKAASLLQHLIAVKVLEPQEEALVARIDRAIASALSNLAQEGNIQCRELVELLADTALGTIKNLSHTQTSRRLENVNQP